MEEIVLKISKLRNPAQAQSEVEGAFYRLGVFIFENLGEGGGLLRGNGHHAAQEVAIAAGKIWAERAK